MTWTENEDSPVEEAAVADGDQNQVQDREDESSTDSLLSDLGIDGDKSDDSEDEESEAPADTEDVPEEPEDEVDELSQELEDSELEEEDLEIESPGDNLFDWDSVSSILRFVLAVKRARPEFVNALNVVMFNGTSGEKLSPLQVAQNVSYEDPRTEVASYFFGIYLGRINGTETREDIFALADWVHELDDVSKRSVSPILAAISAAFPRHEEKLNEQGEVERDESGQPILVEVEPFVPKKSNRNTSSGDILSMIEDTYRSIDHDSFRDFSDWYAKVVEIWPGV